MINIKKFNDTGVCIKENHYMVDISSKIAKIRELIDDRSYFTINKARQYGKTTTLMLVEENLQDDYLVASISFEGIDKTDFETPKRFAKVLLKKISQSLKYTCTDYEYIKKWINDEIDSFDLLGDHIQDMCEDKKVVLIIDEVDKASNWGNFLNFLSVLREKYLSRNKKRGSTFHSVILASVYDIKNLKYKMIIDGNYLKNSEESYFNSPWNIAVNFKVDMDFSAPEIKTMLDEYKYENNNEIDTEMLATEIFKYTSGFPFLVSRLCKIVDEDLEKKWDEEGVKEAVKILLSESNTLFEDIIKNLENNTELFEFIYELLINGKNYPFSIDDRIISLGKMYGFLKEDNGKTIIANRIFEIRIANYLILKDLRLTKKVEDVIPYDIVEDGKFNMEICLVKFKENFNEIFNLNNAEDIKFLEKHGRMVFLSYLKPLLNGRGFYHIESQFTDLRRMDLVVDFNKDQFVIEMKIWRGNSKHKDAYQQLANYLLKKNSNVGYLLTFDLRKNRTPKAEWVNIDGVKIFDVIVG